MSRIKHSLDRNKEINKIAEGIERAEDNKNFRGFDF